MPQWTYEETSGLKVITVPSWQREGAKVVFTTRTGGVSQPPYQSLNLGFHVGDRADLVHENRRRMMELFAGGLDRMTTCQQVHGDVVTRVEEHHRGLGAETDQTALAGSDAMMTAVPGLILATFYADCIPVFFFDPVQKVVAIAHSGWKGTMARIAVKTLQAMEIAYHARPADMQVFIGPGVGRCCYPIQPDLVQKVKAEFDDISDIIDEDEHGYTWDLKETNRLMLEQAGVLPHQIIRCPLCTSCEPDLFFSYRRDRGITGRMGAAISLSK